MPTSSLAVWKWPSISSSGFQTLGKPCSSYRNFSSNLFGSHARQMKLYPRAIHLLSVSMKQVLLLTCSLASTTTLNPPSPRRFSSSAAAMTAVQD
ncbi:hypothetical protein BC938DRAFT_476891 [Jimgerdemannia flammicorona]|uniref:Uncharacterized protein n=1 Tax=Jimgerdemannia flammicorona TaxID=994334 RepID=A0A433QPZ4_9FUNG|nr:hypothetical protein BC938DRAFT_476891 [Jimgerdemannia flammicorona]